MDTPLTDRPPIGPLSLDEYLSWEGEPNVRYELIDGWAYAVTPPAPVHAMAVTNLFRLLDSVCPDGHVVFTSVFGWVLHPGRPDYREPDLLVVPVPQNLHGPGWVERAPLLAVEVVSPTSRRYDYIRKRADYAKAGLEHYWIVDPDGPSVTVFSGAGLAVTAEASGDDGLEVTDPVAVRLVPSELISPRRAR